MKIKNILKSKKQKEKDRIILDLGVEEEMIDVIQTKLKELWSEVVNRGGDASEEEVARMDFMTIELERRTKRRKDLIQNLNDLDKKEGKITSDTVFKGVISILGILLVIFAEETKLLSNKAMGFVIKPRL